MLNFQYRMCHSLTLFENWYHYYFYHAKNANNRWRFTNIQTYGSNLISLINVDLHLYIDFRGFIRKCILVINITLLCYINNDDTF